jgi:hypothetical protein
MFIIDFYYFHYLVLVLTSIRSAVKSKGCCVEIGFFHFVYIDYRDLCYHYM